MSNQKILTMFEGLEKTFQKHIAAFLIREHGFAVLIEKHEKSVAP